MIYLPFIVLILSLVVKIIILLHIPSFYVFDEIIITQISRLSLPQLLNTIRVEPHPPLFYLFLKMFPIENVLISKIIITLVSYLLFFLAFLYAFQRKIIQNHKLSLGLTIFVISFGFLEITSRVKQDSVSLPILFIIAFISLNMARLPSSLNIKELLTAHFLTLVLLFTGYIAYFQAMLVLLLATIYLHKFSVPRYLYLAQALVLSVYFSLYGYSQLVANSQRFTWVNDLYNSLLYAIRAYLGGYSGINFYVEALLIAFAFFFIKSLIKPPSINRQFFLNVVYLIVFLTITAYVTKFFVTIRYISFLFLLISLAVGWGITSSFTKKGYIYLFVAIVFTVNLTYYAVDIVSSTRGNETIESILNRYSKTSKVGLLMDSTISPLIHTLYNQSNENIVPVSVLFPRLLEERRIDSILLMLDGNFKNKQFYEIKSLLSENNLESYVYLLTLSNKQGYYDPERLVLRVLNDTCKSKEFIPLNYNNIIFVFRSCELE